MYVHHHLVLLRNGDTSVPCLVVHRVNARRLHFDQQFSRRPLRQRMIDELQHIRGTKGFIDYCFHCCMAGGVYTCSCMEMRTASHATACACSLFFLKFRHDTLEHEAKSQSAKGGTTVLLALYLLWLGQRHIRTVV